MTKTVRLNPDNSVREIVPESVVALGVDAVMGDLFASQCVDAPDEVEQGWVYAPEFNTFSPPVWEEPNIEPTLQEDVAAMAVDHEYRLTLLELGV